jgi:branched-chain amino acid transport system substrate-binding protein
VKRLCASKTISLVTCLSIIAIMVISCGGTVPPPTAVPPTAAPTEVPATAAPAADSSPIKIGWIGANSGTGAMLGEWDRRGILLAFDAKNAAGGIQGRQLELVVYDDEADPTKAVGLAEKVCTEDKVVAAFATTNSTPTAAVVPIFAKYKIPHITGGIAAAITQQGSSYVFRDTAVGTIYEATIIDYLVKQGDTKFAIIADNGAYGQGEADAQEAALKAHNLTALTREIFAEDAKDFTGQLTKIMQANPEVLLCAGTDVPCGLITKQARSLGFEGKIAGPGSLGTAVFIETAGDAAEGVLYSAPYISNDQSDLTKDFSKRYQEKWNDVAESHGAKAYDGAMVLIMALEAAYPDITGERVAQELHKICGYQGLQGEFCFDATGEGVSVMNIGVIENGQLKAVTP